MTITFKIPIPWKKKAPVQVARPPERKRLPQTGPVRRWEAADSTRLNAAHWATTSSRSINQDLVSQQTTLWNRTAYEMASNPSLEGIADTYTVDVVGATGPKLQVDSTDKGYNAAFEAFWGEWWEMPDINGVLAGVDMLGVWVRSFWPMGEYLAALVDGVQEDGRRLTLRISSLSPRLLATPIDKMAAENVTLGIEHTNTGRPLNYFIARPAIGGAFVGTRLNYDRLLPESIIHGFKHLESGQLRGVPWFATPLQAAADMRDYDVQVLDAARAAADYAAILTTDHPDIQAVTTNESVDIERRTLSTAPPGWRLEQMQAHQPTTRYVDYRAERQRDLGRPANMPLMTIRLDSSGHNYSSARFDGQNYWRGVARMQGQIGRHTMTRLARAVELEARMVDRALRMRPPGTKYRWVWPVAPHVDPVKEANAEKIRLANRTLTIRDAVLANGGDWEDVLNQIAKEQDIMKELGLLEEPAANNATRNEHAEMQIAIDNLLDELQEFQTCQGNNGT